MKIAFLSDIHGNIEALEAVLKDIENRNIDRIYCLGDLVGYGPDPEAVVKKIKEIGIPTIMGNYDDAVGYKKESCGCSYNPGRETEVGDISINWTIENTSEETKEYLKSLPKRIEFTVEGIYFLLVHGSPMENLLEYVKPDTPPERLKEIVSEITADVLVNGHTHITMCRNIMGKTIFNDGSVGRTKDGVPGAYYLIVDVENGSFQHKFIRVDYNIKKTCEKIAKMGLPAELSLFLTLGGNYDMGPATNKRNDKTEFKI